MLIAKGLFRLMVKLSILFGNLEYLNVCFSSNIALVCCGIMCLYSTYTND